MGSPKGGFFSGEEHMTVNDRIAATAWLVVGGNPLLDKLAHGWCLQGVRLVIEHALHWPSHELYRRYLVAGTTGREGDDAERLAAARTDPYASDLEASMKRLGLAIPGEAKLPGDLVFDYERAKPIGHTGIYLGNNLVLEVVSPAHRPRSFTRRNICLTPYPDWTPTLVARLPQEA
jgi:hypothetical protein